MSRKKPPDAAGAGAPAPFHAPFSALHGLRDALPAGPVPVPAPVRAGPARAVVRLERKGRRGKEVTVVEQLQLLPKERAAWLRDMQQALGCGGSLEEGALVLQGDQRERVGAYLRARGVGRVSVG